MRRQGNRLPESPRLEQLLPEPYSGKLEPALGMFDGKLMVHGCLLELLDDALEFGHEFTTDTLSHAFERLSY